MAPRLESQGIDNTVLLLFGALVVILFVLISAAGIQSVEDDARRAIQQEGRKPPTSAGDSGPRVDFGS